MHHDKAGAEPLAMSPYSEHLLSTQDGHTDACLFLHRERRGRTIETLLHASVAEPLPLARIAAAVGLSRSQAVRVFQNATGQTPARYLTCIRMEAARRLLAEGHLTVVEIARRAGYADSSQFARAFRRESGIGPLSYRDAHW
jgi:AraC family transcriptional regulator